MIIKTLEGYKYKGVCVKHIQDISLLRLDERIYKEYGYLLGDSGLTVK